MTFALVLGLAQSWRLGSPGIYPSPSAFRMAENHFGGRGWQAACFFQVQLLSWEGGGNASCHLLGECCPRQLCLSALDAE